MWGRRKGTAWAPGVGRGGLCDRAAAGSEEVISAAQAGDKLRTQGISTLRTCPSPWPQDESC